MRLKKHKQLFILTTAKGMLTKHLPKPLLNQQTHSPISKLIRAIARIQYTIACGHSSWEHSPAYMQYRNKQVRLFPFDIAIIDGRYYTKKDLSMHAGIPDFTEITHINGNHVSKITKTLKRYMNRDGFSNPGNTIEIEQNFKMAYSKFYS